MEWPLIVAIVIVVPIVIFVPLLVWAAVVSGLYQVARDRLRRRAGASRRRKLRQAAEEVTTRETI